MSGSYALGSYASGAYAVGSYVSGARLKITFASVQPVISPGYLSSIVDYMDPSGNTSGLLRGFLDSVDENLTDGFGEWAIYQATGLMDPGPLANTNLESYYLGRMIGDAFSAVAGTAGTIVGVAEIAGAIGSGAGITVGSGGTAAGAGVMISVAGVTQGATLAVAGSAVASGAMGNFFNSQDKYYEAKADRMNADSGGASRNDVPKQPDNAQTITDNKTVFNQLKKHHGIDPKIASERLHEIKRISGRGPADNVIFDKTGNVYDPVTKEWLGSLTQGGAKNIR
jgi:hypothetical protein